MSPDWIQAVAAVVQAIGVIFVAWQAILLRKQIGAEHELARRTRAIDDLKTWSNALDRAHPAARRLVEDFTIEHCSQLIERKPFYISSQHAKLLEYALAGDLVDGELKKTEDGILLNERNLSHLLQLVCTHLNHLEVALQGWYNGIADSKIVVDQFKYVVSIKKGHYILERFRQHELVKDSYPAIAAFVAMLKKQAVGTVPTTRENVA